MWIVIKFKKKELNFFKAEIKEKLEDNLECYFLIIS